MEDTHFDAIVVGSGFGGSVMAYRLAEGDLRVCLLERGKAYPPGSFPRSPYRMRENFWDPSEGLHRQGWPAVLGFGTVERSTTLVVVTTSGFLDQCAGCRS